MFSQAVSVVAFCALGLVKSVYAGQGQPLQPGQPGQFQIVGDSVVSAQQVSNIFITLCIHLKQYFTGVSRYSRQGVYCR